MNINDDEALGLINRLLERLHQADLKNFGSHLQIVYVASGGQHVEKQYNVGASPLTPLQRARGTIRAREVDSSVDEMSLPEALRTEDAMALWEKAQQAGFVDEHYQPLLSRTQAALLADAMAERLGIKEKWKVFEGLWHRRNMYRDYYDAMNQDQTFSFLDKLKQLFG